MDEAAYFEQKRTMMVTGLLRYFKVRGLASPVPPAKWEIEMRIDDTDYRGWTASRIVPAVLQTALLPGPRRSSEWPVEIEINNESQLIERVRIQDDRVDVCKGDLSKRPDKMRVTPLSPTAFADESPPKWGFFFSIDKACREYKGESLDVYVVIESAWREGASVILDFDGHDIVVNAGR